MNRTERSRREFLRTTAAASAAFVPYVFTSHLAAATKPTSANDRLRIGAIGLRYQGSVVTEKALEYGDVVAVCDVDRTVAEKAREQFNAKASVDEDYRRLLDRDDVDAVVVGTPDHWHSKILVDACRAGKDVYCEKPLTLTVDEGKHVTKVVAETKRVVQVGSWQRSDHRFRLAAELVRAARLGDVKKVTVVLGKNKTGGPFVRRLVPKELNWDLWQGQTPDVAYRKERCHYTFRWWQEYSGGQMTDWGAHHLDVAQWLLGQQHSGPVKIEGTANYPEPSTHSYNVAVDFRAKYTYDDGVELEVLDTGRNGVLVEGTKGRMFVNRGTIAGTPVDDLKSNPLPREDWKLYEHDNLERPARMGKLDAIVNHVGNWYDCIVSREQPICDVVTQHRSVSVCHLGNIAMKLGRPLRWDPVAEEFPGDAEANGHLSREQRKGFEVEA